MKNMFSMMLFLLLTLPNSTGQNYESVFDADTTQWNYFTDYNIADYWSTAVYIAAYDTIITDKPYKLLFEDYLWETKHYGYLREDTASGTFWLRFIEDTTEFLLMDLSLEIGDTFLMRNYYNSEANQIYIVDSTRYDQGKKLVFLHSQYSAPYYITFMEGIGVDYIFQVIQEPWIFNIFLCAYKDNNLIYVNPTMGSCYITRTSIDEMQDTDDNYKIYPVPFGDRLKIDYTRSINRINHIVIYNMMGEELFNQYIDSSIIELNLDYLRIGLYLIIINDKYYRKIINGY
jgi:hypothetical protein